MDKNQVIKGQVWKSQGGTYIFIIDVWCNGVLVSSMDSGEQIVTMGEIIRDYGSLVCNNYQPKPQYGDGGEW